MQKLIVVILLLLTGLLGIALSQKRRHNSKPKAKPKVVTRSLTVRIISSAEMVCGSTECPTRESSVNLNAISTGQENAQLTFQWTVSGGNVAPAGNTTRWNLHNVLPGVYTASVKVSDQQGGTGNDQFQIRVVSCGGCQASTPCPVITVACPAEIDGKEPLSFSATVSGGPPLKTTYLWTISSGKILKGETASSLDVAVEDGEDEVRGTVYVGGFDPNCPTIASCTSKIRR